tara:strand:- start:694 stop:1227 length:534 start_codon:yes stop_codon:yes gene_type:complete
MKLKFLFLLIFLVCCSDNIIEEVISSYSEETPKLIHTVLVQGEEKIVLKKLLLKENGDTLNINFGDTLITKYEYYDTDTLKLISSFLYNKKSGEWRYYHENGLIDCIMYYKKNIVDSTYKEFYENGKKAITGFYVNGIREKEWKFYDSDGSLAGDYKYLNGDIYFSSGYYIDPEYVE